MVTIMGALRRLVRFLGFIEISLGGLLLAAITLSILAQVILRYFFRSSIPWVEEFSTGAFVWTVMLGASIALRERAHLTIDFMPLPKNPAARRAMAIVGDTVVLAICLALVVTTLIVLPRESQVTSFTLPITVPKSVFFSWPTLVAAASMSLTSIVRLADEIAGGAVTLADSDGGAL